LRKLGGGGKLRLEGEGKKAKCQFCNIDAFLGGGGNRNGKSQQGGSRRSEKSHIGRKGKGCQSSV